MISTRDLELIYEKIEIFYKLKHRVNPHEIVLLQDGTFEAFQKMFETPFLCETMTVEDMNLPLSELEEIIKQEIAEMEQKEIQERMREQIYLEEKELLEYKRLKEKFESK